MSNYTRYRQILKLCAEPITSQLIMGFTDHTPSTLNTDINAMLQAGFLTKAKEGRTTLYKATIDRLTDEQLVAIAEFANPTRRTRKVKQVNIAVSILQLTPHPVPKTARAIDFTSQDLVDKINTQNEMTRKNRKSAKAHIMAASTQVHSNVHL